MFRATCRPPHRAIPIRPCAPAECRPPHRARAVPPACASPLKSGSLRGAAAARTHPLPHLHHGDCTHAATCTRTGFIPPRAAARNMHACTHAPAASLAPRKSQSQRRSMHSVHHAEACACDAARDSSGRAADHLACCCKLSRPCRSRSAGSPYRRCRTLSEVEEAHDPAPLNPSTAVMCVQMHGCRRCGYGRAHLRALPTIASRLQLVQAAAAIWLSAWRHAQSGVTVTRKRATAKSIPDSASLRRPRPPRLGEALGGTGLLGMQRARRWLGGAQQAMQ
jgi:hypothetical protein